MYSFGLRIASSVPPKTSYSKALPSRIQSGCWKCASFERDVLSMPTWVLLPSFLLRLQQRNPSRRPPLITLQQTPTPNKNHPFHQMSEILGLRAQILGKILPPLRSVYCVNISWTTSSSCTPTSIATPPSASTTMLATVPTPGSSNSKSRAKVETSPIHPSMALVQPLRPPTDSYLCMLPTGSPRVVTKRTFMRAR
jgi:hypothetical protein